MVVRFFMLQAHYRSTLDLTDDALAAAEKGYQRLFEGYSNISKIKAPANAAADSSLVKDLRDGIKAIGQELDDDFNAPKALARMFELVTKINGLANGQIPVDQVDSETITALENAFSTYLHAVFGLREASAAAGAEDGPLDGVMGLVLELRQGARERKDWNTADKIRDTLTELKIQVKDGKEGTSWTVG